MKPKIKGRIKAAYIYNLLPNSIKFFIRKKLSNLEINKLKTGMKEIELLNTSDEKKILNLFINQLNTIIEKKRELVDRSIILSLMILSVLMLTTFIVTLLKYGSTNKILYHMELILDSGGLHIILFPVITTYIKSETSNIVLKIIFSSKNCLMDLIISVIFSIIISTLLFTIGEPYKISLYNPLHIFRLISSVSFGPAVEELFFRYVIFYKADKRIGKFLTSIISSILFTTVHLPESLYVFLVYFLIGMILCGIYHFRKSLFPSFMTHAFSNLLMQVYF